MSECQHKWIGDTCGKCGILWGIYMEKTVQHLEARNAELVSVLEEYQWGQNSHCPCCDAPEWKRNHRPDCELNAVLKCLNSPQPQGKVLRDGYLEMRKALALIGGHPAGTVNALLIKYPEAK